MAGQQWRCLKNNEKKRQQFAIRLMTMKLKIMAAAACFAVAAFATMAQTRVVAHRGYWDAPGASQNSIRSLIKADSIGCWGSEFDVWMSVDGSLFVNHDATINGVEIQSSRARDIKQQRLSNGEFIPTLKQYLQAGSKLKTQLVLELKEHRDVHHEAKAVRKILKMVRKMGLESRMTYITFSLPALIEFIKWAPAGTEVYYLDGDLSPAKLKRLGAAGLDYSLRTMKQHFAWFEDAKRAGVKVNVWTVNDEADMQWCIENGADFITTNAPERLQHLLDNSK
jgi:glycerophosphoryl diester phosphodiesterase